MATKIILFIEIPNYGMKFRTPIRVLNVAYDPITVNFIKLELTGNDIILTLKSI